MWKWMITGAALLVAGALRFGQHLNRTPTLEDYLAFRCGGQTSGAASLFHMDALASAGHCWGCYAMALGALMIAVTALRAVSTMGTGARAHLRG